MVGQMNIIYEDNHLLVVEKPPNMPVQEDASGDIDLLRILKAYIKEKYNKPGDVYLGLVHRLDRPVGGVMVFARTSKAAARLSAQFSKKQSMKCYAAIVCGEVKPEDSLFDYLVRDEKTNTTSVASETAQGAKPARLRYRRVAKKGGKSLIDIELQTGRHHQIRVQLASRNMPIYGDQRYNDTAIVGEQIALWAYALTIEHPTQRTQMRFISMPRGKAWDEFSDELTAMLSGVSIAYIDEDIIVADKPYGLSVAIDDGDDDTLEGRLDAAFGEVYPIHRIDATTKGLVLFARNANSRNELMSCMREGRIKKFYTCEVVGVPPKRADTLYGYAVKDAERGIVKVYDNPCPGAKEMITAYRLLSENDGTSTLEIELFTGRTHQIRAQLAHLGNPILGDDKYGDREMNRALNCREVQLTAKELRIERDGKPTIIVKR